jgi:arginine utilization protein RocB
MCLDDMESTGRIGPNRRKHFSVRVLTLQDLEAELSARDGFEAYRAEAKARSEQVAASGETLLWASALYIRDIMAFAGGGPMVVAGIAPPYYPAVNNDFLGKDIAPIVEDTIAALRRENGIHVAQEDYSQAMMDLSYMSCANPDSARRIMGNVPLPESLYGMDVDAMARLEIPCLVIGPARKEIHQLGERVYLPDVERDLPIVFRQIIRSAENT